MPSTTRRSTADDGFTPEERAAMKARARETRVKRSAEDDLAEVLDKIAAMPDADRRIATRVHEIVTVSAPALTPRTWYGMPAYAKDGKVLLFFQDAAKFKARYATLGFSDVAALDAGGLWPTSYAVAELSPEVESQIAELVRRAVG